MSAAPIDESLDKMNEFVVQHIFPVAFEFFILAFADFDGRFDAPTVKQ